MTRVQIPAYTDRWMQGDRYGEIVGKYRKRTLSARGTQRIVEMVHVKLDKSGKTVRVILDDCTVIS
jgi:hypothetical protein